MIAAALAIAPGDTTDPHWIFAIDKARLPYGPADLFGDVALSTEPMGNMAFVTYRDMPKGCAVAQRVGGQWQKWIKA